MLGIDLMVVGSWSLSPFAYGASLMVRRWSIC